MKIYECLQYRVYKKGETLCKYGDIGDRFFIILKGQVGILVPQIVETDFNSTWDVFNFALSKF